MTITTTASTTAPAVEVPVRPRAAGWTKRRRGRPPKVRPLPNSQGLPSLPAEVIGRIASFLLPAPTNASTGFAPPTELPYGFKKGITRQDRFYRYGGIPSGVRDVLRLARTCRHCDRAVSLVVGKIGNAATTDPKSTLYISLPDDREVPTDQNTQTAIDASECSKLLDRIGASQLGLERLIVYKCPHEARQYGADYPIHSVTPFHLRSISFPKLEHLELGPSVCWSCSSSVLHLFCSTRFRQEQSRPEFGVWRRKWNLYRTDAFYRNDPNHIESPAAPNMTSLTLNMDRTVRNSLEFERELEERVGHIGNPDKIQMLQIWLSELQEAGGLGPTGTVTDIRPRGTKMVEQELTDWAEQERSKQRATQDRLLAKFAAQAKTLLPTHTHKTGSSSAQPSDKSQPDLKADDGSASIKSGNKNEANGNDGPSDPPATEIEDPPTGSTESRASRNRQSTGSICRHGLVYIARSLPNLVGLSILRKGKLRTAIVEGTNTLDEFGRTFVQPLAKLQHLRYLDLGIAAVAPSEVTDFPLGLSLSTTRLGKQRAKDVDTALQALKRRKYTLDVAKAKKEGDKWRKSILAEFVDTRTESDDDGKIEDTPDANANGTRSESSAPPEERPVAWPRSLKSGYFIVPELEYRLQGIALMVPWRVEGQTVVLDPAIRMRM